MKRRFIIAGIIAGIFLTLALLFLFLKNNVTYSPQVPQEGCNVMQTNPGNKKIDLVFFTDGATYETVKEYAHFLLNASPYKEHKEKFNIYYANETKCGMYEDALFCYEKALLKKAALCPNDYIIVLVNKPPEIRSSFYIQVASINIHQPKSVFLHEFGHAFANLADEYVPSKIPIGSQNCQKKCNFFEKYIGIACFQGCSDADYYRSSEASVMRTLKTEEYHTVNEEIIKEKLRRYE